MNVKKFIVETKDYIHNNAGTYARGDLHTMPQIHREDLLRYLQSLHNRFPRNKFLRFIKKLQSRRMIIESSERSLTFDPIFLF
ncbi:MAG: hypothetical protein EPN39_08165 [Chitinophagaceae bacterium]|jgi:hypothetical protein|nr:MAG: hypothetical protein EPN39_08165 [Chitinophagaceae bacterium]